MNQQKRKRARHRVVALGLAYVALPIALVVIKLDYPEVPWRAVAVPLAVGCLLALPMLYATNSLMAWVEEKRRLRAHCAKCGHELSRPGAYRCGDCRRLTVDGYRAIVGWSLAMGVIALFWLVSGWIMG